MTEANTPPAAGSPKLLDQVRARVRAKHYSIRTETQYVQWIGRFILFNGKRHPRDMGIVEVEAFLTHLAVESKVSASTQNQALAALLFLYREVLRLDLPGLKDVVRARAFSYLLYGHSRVGRESLPNRKRRLERRSPPSRHHVPAECLRRKGRD
jgi:hypothetical protein